MESTRLLDALTTDAARLRSVASAADLDRPVPSCPGWTLADLVRHVAEAYLHKVDCMRLGTRPDPWPPAGLAEEEPLALFDRAYAALSAEFDRRKPADPAFTWYGPDQSVGFWIRRMAQETVVHRFDAELGAGVEPSAIPDDLAVDGLDEFLVTFLEYGSRTWPEDFTEVLAATDGRSVRLETDGAAFLVRLTPELVEVRSSDLDGESAVVRADPATLLLWVWSRVPDDAVERTGDPELLAALRHAFVVGAQ